MGDGTPYGISDKSQENGISADICADKIIKAIKQKKDKIVIAKRERIGLLLNRFASGLLRKIVRKVHIV